MNRFSAIPLLAAAALSALAQAGNPQPPAAQRQRVSEVAVRTSGAVHGAEARDYVLSHVSASEGAFVTQRDLAEDQRALVDSGLFSDVRIFMERADGGARIVYDVKMAPRLRAPLSILGNKAFSTGKVRDSLDLDNGERVDRASLDAACDRLRDAYRKSYYNNAKVTATTSDPDEDGFVGVTIEIDEGVRDKLSTFVFEGNKSIPSGELRAALGRPAWYNPFAIFYSQWRRDAFDHALVRDRIVAAYRERGFLDVKVGEPTLSRKSPTSRPVMHVAITEGRRYVVKSASISGVSLFPEEELRQTVSDVAKPGSPASDKAVRDIEKAVRDYYGYRGYVETEATAKMLPVGNAPAGEEDVATTVRVEVKEGFLAHIRSITVRGNTYTKDKVVRRELVIAPGMIMNEVLAETSRLRVENLGFFEQVRLSEFPAKEDPTLRDVVYDVAEKSTGNLMVGVGTSDFDDLIGYIDITQNNFDILNWPTFRGAGQKIRLTASAGSSSNSGEISWTDPWFLDRQQSFTATIYRREYGFSEYDETRIGGDVALGVPLKYGRFITKLGAEVVSNDDFIQGLYHLETDPEGEFHFDEIDHRYLRVPLRLAWLYDTRNHPFTPTRGSRNNVFFEIQNADFGSDYDLYRTGVELRQYLPALWRHYISIRLRAESVDCYGDTDEVPANDRYYLGGARSIRGYRHREVGPKAIPDETTGGRAHPVGGNTLAMASAEYNIPIVKVLRLAAFYDIGNVWAESFDADFGEYASSWGFGIRFDIPGFPIRLDYAFPVHHDDEYTRHEHFVFSIGFD